MARAPFRNLIFFLRIAAGLCATGSLALYVVIITNLIDTYAPEAVSLTILPLIAGGIAIIWNIVSIIFMLKFRTRTFHLILVIGDFLVFVAAAVLGSVGFYHDDMTALGQSSYLRWANDSRLPEEEGGAILLLIVVLIQLVLVLVNFLEHRHLKETGKRMSLPPYPGFPREGQTENRNGIDDKWESVESEDEEPLPSVVRKPVAAVAYQ